MSKIINFESFIKEAKRVLKGESDADVPCGDCTACCTSSYFKLIEPHEKETLKHIPKAYLSYSFGLSEGSSLLGYDENGHCHMLKDGRCSIYENRPRTCRKFDCRVFVISGLPVEEDDKRFIQKRVDEWEMTYSNPNSEAIHEHLKYDANHIDPNDESIPKDTTRRSEFIISNFHWERSKH